MTVEQEHQLSLGSRLRKARQECGLGIKSAAPKVSISYSYLSKIENSQKSPSQGLLIRLAKLYQMMDSEVALLIKELDEQSIKSGNMPDDIKKIIKTHGDDVFDLIRKTFSDNRGN